MIRKRIKKRRNPSMEEELRERRLTGYIELAFYLSGSIKEGNPDELVNAIILYKQGLICYDCYNEELGETPRYYTECICEKCPHCGFRRDLCYLDMKYRGPHITNYTDLEKNKIREATYELILEILADDVYNNGRKYTIIPNVKYKELNKLKKEFLTKALQKDDLYGADLSNTCLPEIDFSEKDLSKQCLFQSLLHKANLTGADLTGADLRKTDLTEANLTEANLTGADLTGADLTRSNLKKANLHKACLNDVNLYKADLREANINETILINANLFEANFKNSIIKNTNFFDNVYGVNEAIDLIIPNPRKKSIRRRK